jgi:GMP synthase (glutamine-hydrolysing)
MRCGQLGGRVTLSEHQEFGRAFIDIFGECALFDGLWSQGSREQVWTSHGDRVDALPPGSHAVAASEAAPRRSRRSAARWSGEGIVCSRSGGVDSAVVAALLHEAIGDRLTCIFVDTGLLRVGEAQEVVSLFAS